MADLVLCEPIELYNILNQVTKLSRLTEPNYLCLLVLPFQECHRVGGKQCAFQTGV